jgi:hypothetical protein
VNGAEVDEVAAELVWVGTVVNAVVSVRSVVVMVVLMLL